MRSYQQCGERVTLVRDKLYVNNRLYDLDTNSFVNRPLQPSQQHPPFNTRDQTVRVDERPPRAHQGAYPERGGPLLPPPPSTRPAARAPARLNFETPNRFSALSEPAKTSLKRKERSPTESQPETEAKRIDTTDSPTESQEQFARHTPCENMLVDTRTLADNDSISYPWADLEQPNSSQANEVATDGPPAISDHDFVVTNK